MTLLQFVYLLISYDFDMISEDEFVYFTEHTKQGEKYVSISITNIRTEQDYETGKDIIVCHMTYESCIDFGDWEIDKTVRIEKDMRADKLNSYFHSKGMINLEDVHNILQAYAKCK